MKRAALAIIISLCLLLSGCGVLTNGEYIWLQTHPIPAPSGSNQSVSAATYQQLYAALANMIEAGTVQSTISVAQYDKETLEADVQTLVDSICLEHPIAAYAVENIGYVLGTSGGETALSVEIVYLHDQAEIKKIKTVADQAAAYEAVTAALRACETGIVLQIEAYEAVDFEQLVKDYAMEYPQYVMETPEVTENVYPKEGTTRVVELKFKYQTSRDSLKNMQLQVEPVFESAVLYVSGDGADREKYSQMYSFLMERYNYTVETSITPAYSLLRHGVGDSKAFAAVYAAMCRQAGLECYVVTGTRSGELWFWNIVCIEGVYYHVDLLHCKDAGAFTEMTDEIKGDGYVWDFPAYPPCGVQPQPPAEE